MVSKRELSLNVVRSNEPKMLLGLGQKALRRVLGLAGPRAWATNAVGGQREPNPSLSLQRNTVSPYRSPPGVERPQGPPMVVRVKDEGESEGRPVIGRIRGATFPGAKASPLPSGLASRESGANRQGGRADDGRAVFCWCGFPRDERASAPPQYREGAVREGSSWATTASGNGRWSGLSRVRGNSLARFLGGGEGATLPCYPETC
jgi:hypothetical protein